MTTFIWLLLNCLASQIRIKLTKSKSDGLISGQTKAGTLTSWSNRPHADFRHPKNSHTFEPNAYMLLSIYLDFSRILSGELARLVHGLFLQTQFTGVKPNLNFWKIVLSPWLWQMVLFRSIFLSSKNCVRSYRAVICLNWNNKAREFFFCLQKFLSIYNKINNMKLNSMKSRKNEGKLFRMKQLFFIFSQINWVQQFITT